MAPNATRYLENCLDNRLSFYAYRALYGMHGTGAGGLFRFSKKLSDRELLRRKYHENGYIHFFKTARIREAYRLRLAQAVEMERGGDASAAAKASDYLDVVNQGELLDWLEPEGEIAGYLKGRAERGRLFRPSAPEGGKTGRILFCGPSAEMAGRDFRGYGKIVLMKPVPIGPYGMEPGQIDLLLNNQWSIGKKDEVFAWAAENREARIFSPNPLGLPNEVKGAFGAIPRFPFGSFMGLQRALAIFLAHYRFDSIELAGFDFSLSENAYRPWYPSLILEQYRSHQEAFKDTYRKHDFLLNFMYVRKVAERGLVSGSVVEYTSMDLRKVIAILECKLNTTGPA